MKNKITTDRSTPYRTNGGGKICAPVNTGKNEPKATKVTTAKDLRGGK